MEKLKTIFYICVCNNTLIQLQARQLTFDFLAKTVILNSEPCNQEFHILSGITDWFDKDLIDNKIERAFISKVTLVVDFILTHTDGVPKSMTKKIIELNLKMKSIILTDEKEYSIDKEKAMEYHYINNPKPK